MILFSILVHEQPGVIINQIENFRFYNPESLIILHVSGFMPEADYRSLAENIKQFDFVTINPKRLFSGYADGSQFKMHVENMKHALQSKLNFDYFALHASNDMFVRRGLYDFMKQYDSGFPLGDTGHKEAWQPYRAAVKDRRLKKCLKRYKLSIQGAQVEGTFYKKTIIGQAIDRFEALKYEIPFLYAHGYNRTLAKIIGSWKIKPILKRLIPGLFYAKEEIYFPSLTFDLVKRRLDGAYCYVNWSNNMIITIKDIENIRSGNFGALQHQAGVKLSETEFFAVKRVDRKIDDPVRQYITGSQK